MSGARVASLVSSLVLIAALGACARLGPPAPVVQGTSAPPPRVAGPALPQGTPMLAPAATQTTTTPGEVVVRAGDSLYMISRRHSIPMRAIIDANSLEPPYVLQTGQRLTLPRVRTYEVQAGDTLSGIARRFGLGTSEMVRANAIAPPYHVQAGQVLILPGGEALPGAPATMVAERTPAPALSTPAAPAPVVETPAAPVFAARPSPGVASAPAAVAAPEASPTDADRERVVAGLPPPTQSEAPVAAPSASAPRLAPAPEPVAVTPRAVAPPVDVPDDPPAKAGRGFIWPVRGTIVSDYGSKPGGLQNDGINIAAPRGTPIRAAEGGSVVYAGNELRGFGNLLLVRHRDGWITAYAHADELLVKRGDSVRRGQVIARVGSSGAVSSPQLHFEVRRGARHVNPRDVLAPQTARAF